MGPSSSRGIVSHHMCAMPPYPYQEAAKRNRASTSPPGTAAGCAAWQRTRRSARPGSPWRPAEVGNALYAFGCRAARFARGGTSSGRPAAFTTRHSSRPGRPPRPEQQAMQCGAAEACAVTAATDGCGRALGRQRRPVVPHLPRLNRATNFPPAAGRWRGHSNRWLTLRGIMCIYDGSNQLFTCRWSSAWAPGTERESIVSTETSAGKKEPAPPAAGR